MCYCEVGWLAGKEVIIMLAQLKLSMAIFAQLQHLLYLVLAMDSKCEMHQILYYMARLIK